MDKRKICVSVVIPCFNCATTIRRAVQSVLVQTALPAEIILIDDYSDDQTKLILHELQALCSDDFIKIVRLSKNSGPGTARNVGWDMATSDYVAFLDADDSWHPKKLELQHSWMINNPEFYLSGHNSMSLTDIKRAPIDILEIFAAQEILPKHLLLRNVFPTRSIMVKRNLRSRFKVDKRYAEDYLLWLRIILTEGRCAFSKCALAFSYKRDFGVSGLSGKLWEMQKGEVENYLELHNEALITTPTLIKVLMWSFIKFIRRIVIGFVDQFRKFKY